MIKEVIVVEGKNDTKNLQKYFECETIETHGLGLTSETISFIKEINNKRGVILFLDPDSPGEKIRKRINDEIPNLKNAFVMKEDARTSKKVGIEHADKKVLEEALNNVVTYVDTKSSISNIDLLELDLVGKSNSKDLRNKISKELHIGKCNAKTMLKRLNMIGVTKDDVKKVLSK